MQKVNKIMAVIAGLLLSSCATTTERNSKAAEHLSLDYREVYGVYPGVAGNGVAKHLARSHTSAILVRPASSIYELSNRLCDQIWDTGRRLDIRFVRVPTLDSGPVPDLSPARTGMDLEAWEKYLNGLCGRKTSMACVEFIMSGEAFYAQLERAIDEARTSIDIQTYLFDNDDVARAIADRLRASSREVEVRVMYDGIGTYLSHFATAATQPEDAAFIENIPRYLCKDSGIRLRVIPNTWLSGNHVKNMIFDRRVAFVGGMNIGREYRHEWHDMMIRLEGDVVNLLLEDFQSTWDRSGWGGDFTIMRPKSSGPTAQGRTGDVPVRLLYTLPAKAQIYRAQLEAIRRAGDYIYIENAYFADDRILYELCRARRRGVDVRVIMPSVVNHTIMELSNRVAINTLLENGIRVYLYPKMSHIKAAVYDGWICVGTANFDKLSLQINRELNLATSHTDTVNQLLENLFNRDFKQSTEILEPVPLNLKDHLIELIADET